jgi:hypothetical protein
MGLEETEPEPEVEVGGLVEEDAPPEHPARAASAQTAAQARGARFSRKRGTARRRMEARRESKS